MENLKKKGSETPTKCWRVSPVRVFLRSFHAQTAVNKFTGGFDGGGGFSTIFASPDYQSGHVQAYAKSDAAPPAGTFNGSNRFRIFFFYGGCAVEYPVESIFLVYGGTSSYAVVTCPVERAVHASSALAFTSDLGLQLYYQAGKKQTRFNFVRYLLIADFS